MGDAADRLRQASPFPLRYEPDILGRFAEGSWGWLQRRLDRAIDAGEARADLAASRVLELIAGSTLIATMIRPLDELDAAWIDQTTDIIMRGITP